MKNLLLGNCINNIHKAGLVLLYGFLCLNTSYVQAQNDTVIDVHPNHYCGYGALRDSLTDGRRRAY